MIYYRIAWKNNSSSSWEWKSTKLSSLDALFGFLRVHNALTQDRLCIFSAPSVEELNEQLGRKNSGLDNASIPIKEFLEGIDTTAIGLPEAVADAEELTAGVPHSDTATDPLADEPRIRGRAFSNQGMSDIDSRRVVSERGRGGDHDVLYTFTLPVSLPQILAWTKLLAKVERGELAS